MLKIEDAAGFADKLTRATGRTVRDFAKGKIRHEEPFSDELCGRLKETLEDFETPNVLWQVDLADGEGSARFSANTLSKYGEERAFGADVVMVLDIDVPGYKTLKGILIQSKILELGDDLSKAERNRLVGQCKQMLEISQESFVFLYGSHAVVPLSAQAVVAANGENLHELAVWDISMVYLDFAICWKGDTKIQATDRASLEALRASLQAKVAVRVTGRSRSIDKGSDEPKRKKKPKG